MTDNEIIKALECCIAARRRADCIELKCPACVKEGCAYCNRIEEDEEDCDGGVFAEIAKDIAGVIKRQKAEIERIEDLSLQRHIRIQQLVGENKRIKQIRYLDTRAEAIKEFAERVKAKAYTNNYWHEVVLVSDIDKLVKEFTEGEKP